MAKTPSKAVPILGTVLYFFEIRAVCMVQYDRSLVLRRSPVRPRTAIPANTHHPFPFIGTSVRVPRQVKVERPWHPDIFITRKSTRLPTTPFL